MAAIGKCLRVMRYTCCHQHVALWSTVPRRHLLSRRVLALDRFEEAAQVRKEKFGRRLDDFKAGVLETAENGDIDLLHQDCISYIYLMDKGDLAHLDTVLRRHLAQVAEDEQAGLTSIGLDLAGLALRRCYLLGDCDAALQVFHLYESHSTDMMPSLAVLLDLLYINGRHADCAEIAFRHVIRTENLLPKQLQPLLTLAFLSALTLTASKDLSLHIAFRDAWVRMGGPSVKYAQWLFALHCIRQGRTNAALNTLNNVPLVNQEDRVIDGNLRAHLYLKNNNPNSAFHILLGLKNSSHKSEASVLGETVIFSDLIPILSSAASRRNHAAFIKAMRKERDEKGNSVHKLEVAEYLTNRLTRHYSGPMDRMKNVPLFDEEIDGQELSHYSDAFHEVGLAADEEAGPDAHKRRPTPRTKSSNSKGSSKPQKMIVVNGYITFVDSEA